MKNIRYFALSFILGVLLTATVFAQTQPPTKVAVLDTNAFSDEKTGITKIINLFKQLKTEFKPAQDEIVALNTKIKALENEIKLGQTAKASEYEQLVNTRRIKAEDAQVKYNKRLDALLGSIYKDMQSALDTFSRQKGITLILDPSKMQGIIWSLESTDITKEFIAFYNAR